MTEMNPMIKQYAKLKEENKDSVLLFRLGDFYELFYDGVQGGAACFLHEVEK